MKNAQKLANVLSREGNPYEYADLRNLINFSVPRSTICYDVCHRDELGIKALDNFREARMVQRKDDVNDKNGNVDSIPFWSTLPRNNFQMFSDTQIIVNEKQKRLTTLKKEKQLYARMLVALKARPELSPESIIGNYEFTNIPPSNFSPDGATITVKSNDSLMNLIMQLPISEDESDQFYEISTKDDSAIIVNATEVLEIVKKKKPLANVSDLVKHFLLELEKIVADHTEFRLIFHRYDTMSVSNVKGINPKKAVVHYHVKSNTPIKNFDNFFAHVNTRIELSSFVGQAVLKHFEKSTIKHLVAYGKQYFISRSLAGETELSSEHAFTDLKQIILSNVADIAKFNRNRALTIFCEDMDLAVLLIGLFDRIPPNTKMKWNSESISIFDLYSRLGSHLSGAIIGWYVFNGK